MLTDPKPLLKALRRSHGSSSSSPSKSSVVPSSSSISWVHLRSVLLVVASSSSSSSSSSHVSSNHDRDQILQIEVVNPSVEEHEKMGFWGCWSLFVEIRFSRSAFCDLGLLEFEGLILLMKNWYDLFMPLILIVVHGVIW